jgi:transposase-like protein
MDITNPIYSDPNKAREHLEKLLWPNGPFCPHCGNVNSGRITKLEGNSTRPGVYKCNECEKPFSVTVGTVFESSHIPLNKWLYATHKLNSGKKGTSAHQLHRELGVSYKTAWFMCHRIREAMAPTTPSPLGGEGKVVEADETEIGGKAKNRAYRRHVPKKTVVLSLVERVVPCGQRASPTSRPEHCGR